MARRNVNSYAVFQNVDDSVSLIFKYEGGGADVVRNLSLKESRYIVDLMRNEKPIAYDHDRRRIWTRLYEQVGQAEGGELSPYFNMSNWLASHVSIRNAINWEFPGGNVRNYTDWDQARKQDLAEAYHKVLTNRDLGLVEAPPLFNEPQGNAQAVSKFGEEVAWQYYIGHIAHSLVVEADRRVNWSMAHLSDEERAAILDGRSFYIRRNNDTYDISRSIMGGVTYGNPSRLYEFLMDNNLIGSNHTVTIARVIRWCRRMRHYTGGNEADNVFDQWQYRGLPPIERVINGTPMLSRPEQGIHHRTGGCWGTTGFFRALLRIINIPVELTIAGSHAIPHFMTINSYLSHGDDPYNQMFKDELTIPERELLISEATFQEWFIENDTPRDNVGRQVRELALQYLPAWLMRRHCDDRAVGRNHANSLVARAFDRNYTVAELEAMRLWERLDEKIASLGGCNAID